ncbi:MAG: YggS family pyridoxal phosphate-dependent enzyme [Pirellulales bacterium]|nr:YggS family pyridoxal phosphate-dependent enzyme [Pirellulales bacterium]
MSDLLARIQENLEQVRGRIEAAARRSGRGPEEVRLVAVTKYVGPEAARALSAAGCRDLGESRPQELWRKAEALADLPIHWHLIGHLQRNKIRRTLPLVGMIHSLDSLRLARAIETEIPSSDRRVPVLLEVNVSGEAAKTGISPEAVEPLLAELSGLPHLDVRGMMTMAALEGGPDAARRDFAALRELRNRLLPCCPEGVALTELSMGMSGDFEMAIEEGATIVRVGTALFEGIEG